MSNYLRDGLKSNGHTPVKRLGLSRKRKSSCLHQLNALAPSVNAETCSGTEIMKRNISPEMCNKNLKVEENFQNKTESKSVPEQSILDTQTKYEKKIKEMENLYSIWANGFKNAIFYLVNLLEKRLDESVNVKELLIQLRIWGIISDHFKDDSDLCIFLNDSEGSD